MGFPARGAPKTLMARAVEMLSRREHSRLQIARKLKPHLGPDEDQCDVDRVLDSLQQQNLLSDERFAVSLVRQRSPRYGDLRLTRDLRERGIAPLEAGVAMALVEGTEAARALGTWSRRFGALPTSIEERGRQGRYLQNRGFSMEAIARVLAGKVDPTE